MADKENIALIPGGFKPPTKAHLALVKFYLLKVGDKGKVVILMGSGGEGKKPQQRKIGNSVISFSDSMRIWKIYLDNAGIPFGLGEKLNFQFTQQPMKTVIDYVTHKANAETQTIHLGTGRKDAGRFRSIFSQGSSYNPNDVKIEFDEMPEVRDKNGKDMSASNMNNVIVSGDYETFLDYIPEESLPQAKEIWNFLHKKTLNEDVFYSLIEEVLNEHDTEPRMTMRDDGATREWTNDQEKKDTSNYLPNVEKKTDNKEKKQPAASSDGAVDQEITISKDKEIKIKNKVSENIAAMYGPNDYLGTSGVLEKNAADRENLEEISIGAAVEGAPNGKKDGLIREEELVEEIINYLFNK